MQKVVHDSISWNRCGNYRKTAYTNCVPGNHSAGAGDLSRPEHTHGVPASSVIPSSRERNHRNGTTKPGKKPGATKNPRSRRFSRRSSKRSERPNGNRFSKRSSKRSKRPIPKRESKGGLKNPRLKRGSKRGLKNPRL